MEAGKTLKPQNRKVLIQVRDLRVGNGIAACIMNYYEYTVTHGYEIDFLMNRNIASPYTERIKKYGSNIFTLPHDTNKPNRENYRYIETLVSRNYDILHVNLTGLNAVLALRSAKKAGVAQRIYHAHSPKETSSLKAGLRSLLYDSLSVWFANQYAACTTLAGNSVFGKKPYAVVKNAVNTSEFVYDEHARQRLRNDLKIGDAFVVGVVARFAEQKNPYFIIDIFAEIKRQKANAYLIWAGDGNLKASVRNYARKKGVQESVVLLGSRQDVNKLYSAMDVFLLPSKFEGFGIVFIEAQLSGLPCFGSDRVPEDVEISEHIYRIGLNRPAAEWAHNMISAADAQTERKAAFASPFERSDLEHALCTLYR